MSKFYPGSIKAIAIDPRQMRGYDSLVNVVLAICEYESTAQVDGKPTVRRQTVTAQVMLPPFEGDVVTEPTYIAITHLTTITPSGGVWPLAEVFSARASVDEALATAFRDAYAEVSQNIANGGQEWVDAPVLLSYAEGVDLWNFRIKRTNESPAPMPALPTGFRVAPRSGGTSGSTSTSKPRTFSNAPAVAPSTAPTAPRGFSTPTSKGGGNKNK